MSAKNARIRARACSFSFTHSAMMSLAPARASSGGGDPLFGIDEGRGFGERVERPLLGEDPLGKGFQPLLPGHGSPRPPFGTEGQVDVLEDGEGFGGSDPAFQLIGEEFALGERFEDRLPSFVQFRELGQSVADSGDLDLVEGPRDLLPVAGDEGNRPPLAEEYGRGRDLRPCR